MRSSWLSYLLVIFCIASCGMEDIAVDEHEEREIRFGVSDVTVSTRAIASSTMESLKSNGFGCMAVLDWNDRMLFCQGAYYNSSEDLFMTDDTYFFPSTGTVSFYAVYPESTTMRYSSGRAVFSYENDGHSDIIVSSLHGIDKSSGVVELGFSHALSQAMIECKGDDENVDYVVESVQIYSTASADYSFNDRCFIPTSGISPSVYSNYDVSLHDSFHPIGSSMSFIPGTVLIRVKWACYGKNTDVLVGKFDQSIEGVLTAGRRTTFYIILPCTVGSDIMFTTSVNAWSYSEEDYRLE